MGEATLPVVTTVNCDEVPYINRGLVGYGSLPSNAKDQFSDTLGGFGSGIAPDLSSFHALPDGSITGIIYAAPDRGWNTQNSVDYQNRIHKFNLTVDPVYSPTISKANVHLEYLESVLIKTLKDVPTTGLDATSVIKAEDGLPDLPAALTPAGRLSPALDVEGIVRLADGSYWISDEYGPYIYHVDSAGHIVSAIRPPDAFIPMRNGSESFSSGNPPADSKSKALGDPDTGRENNKGFEGIAISPDERYLSVVLQGALVQDSGKHGNKKNNTRILKYDVIDTSKPVLVAEYVVQTPGVNDPTKDHNPRSTSISELHYLCASQYFVLTRDSGHGRGSQSDTPSTYRHIDMIGTNPPTSNIAQEKKYNKYTGSIAPDGDFRDELNPTSYCAFIDFNDAGQLSRFGLHNGSPYDGELNEKWESLAVIPVPKGATGYGENEYLIMSISDNDFITQDGSLNFGKTSYKDPSGLDVSTQVLIWQANLPNYGSRE